MNETIITLDWTTIVISLAIIALLACIVVWLFNDPNLWTSLVAALIITSIVVWLCLTYDNAKIVLHKRGAEKAQKESQPFKPFQKRN